MLRTKRTALVKPKQAVPVEEGLKKREGDTWASSGVNFSERKIVVLLLNALPFSDLPYSPA
jgi:hypothetical protein